MKVKDYTKFKLFDYEQYWDGDTRKTDKFHLGDVVINEENEVGVIIQCHGKKEYRTDMFGNCCQDELKTASLRIIEDNRFDIIEQLCI